MIPKPDEWFGVKGRRGLWRCLAVTDLWVECYGGSTDPGGRKGFRTFPLTTEFRVRQQKERSRG